GINGDEVVQLYVRDPVAQVARPVQEMRGFARVSIPAGETRRVAFTLSPEQFAYFAPSGQFEADAGRIDFRIGSSSDDIRLTGSFDLSASVISDAPGAALVTRVDIKGE
ncbi:MAG: fibronectin type III-like domain-contianing protein, partial [Hyphomonas sp.]